jgi:isopentenyl phosphate kinase
MFQTFSMMLVKLGGSVITDKTRYRTFRPDAVTRLAGEIKRSGKTVLVVHGAGSYGHVLASKFQLQHGHINAQQIGGAAQVMEDVRELDLEIIRALNREGVPSVSLPPSACALLKEGRLIDLDISKFQRYLALGVTPVTFGDVALDSVRGFGICSGDQLMELLAINLRPERIVFCCDVDGVFTADPASDPQAQLIRVVDQQTLADLPRTQRCEDVTGSIFGKLECMMRMASHGGDAVVINGMVPGRLEAALRGEKVIGSKVVGGDA